MDHPITAIYDANVLYPAPIRDLFLRIAQSGLVFARWTESGPELVHELGNASGQNSITCSIRAFRDSAIDLLKTHLGLICGKQDIISSGGRGYRFNDWITIQDTRKAETDPIEIEDTPASRHQRILGLLGDGGKLRPTCIANHLGCSLKTVKRSLETLRFAGRIEFIGPSKTGTYQLVQV